MTDKIATISPGLISSLVQKRFDRRQLASKLSEIILGGQDGLVNVAGIILGLAAATNDVRIIIAGGLAATFAESISMAAVAYTSTLADKDYYAAELTRVKDEIRLTPEKKRQQLSGLFRNWGFDGRLLDEAVDRLSDNEDHFAELMVANDLKLQPVEKNGLLWDSTLVGISAVVGSLVPLWPFFFFSVSSFLATSCPAATVSSMPTLTKEKSSTDWSASTTIASVVLDTDRTSGSLLITSIGVFSVAYC